MTLDFAHTMFLSWSLLFILYDKTCFFCCCCSSQVPDKISVTTQLCNFSTKGAIDSMQMSRCGAGPVNSTHTVSRLDLAPRPAFDNSPAPDCEFRSTVLFLIVFIQPYFSSAWRNPFNILKMLMAINSLCLCLDGIVSISSSVWKGTFSGNRILGQPFLTPSF